ncbi:MAG: LiaF transmembrane domain-containing protein [Steroidobacteraceae bacterium]
MQIDNPRNLERRPHPLGVIIVGLVVIAFGLSLLADNLGWSDAHEFFRSAWPLLLVLAGAGIVLQHRQGRGFWGIALILAGLWSFADQQHWLRVNFWAVFGPTLIVLVGASLIWRSITRPRPDSVGDSYVHSFAVFSGAELRPTAPFQGADLTAVLGGAKLDLTSTPMAGDSATIDVFAFMGGVEIWVPSDWNVVVKVGSFMGACVDKRRPSTLPPVKQLIIRGSSIMGGVEIKN